MRYQKLPQKCEIDELQFTAGPYNLQSETENRRSNFALMSLLLILLFFSNFLLLSCSESDNNAPSAKQENEAKIIKKQADYLWRTNKEIDALKLYKELALKFPETSVKKSAEDKLLKTGISIGSPLVSWSSQLMFKMENTIIDYRDQNGAYPLGQRIKHPIDAWGNEIYFRTFRDNKKIYDFIVYSNGPDRLKGTADDILVVHEKDESTPVGNTSGPQSLDEIRTMRDNLESTGSSEVTLSIDSLTGLAESGNSNSKSEGMELSLEELRKFGESK